MKLSNILLCCLIILMASASLQAGEMVLYAGSQKPGTLTFDSLSEVPGGLMEGTWGGTFGARFSAGNVVGLEQNFSYSPRFAVSGVKAFQMDTNLLLQAPGRFVPYATAGIGYLYTWGQNSFPEDLDHGKIAAYAFNIGSKFAFNYGGGIKIRSVLGPMGFNFDVRGYTIPNARDSSLSFIQMSVGPVFTW